MKNKNLYIIVTISLGILGSFYLFAPLAMPASNSEWKQVRDLSKYIENNFESKELDISLKAGAEIAPWSYLSPHKVILFGEINKEEQNEIIALISEYKRINRISPVRVIFKSSSSEKEKVTRRKYITKCLQPVGGTYA